MNKDTLILGQDQFYSLDCHETKLNNNVLVVGSSGAGKTRGLVVPNLLQASGSYVVSDPKGDLYKKYKGYLEARGYVVKKLDFTDVEHSAHYNFFRYIRNTQDIVKIAHMLMYQRKNGGSNDPFWDEAGQLLIESVIAYLMEVWTKEEQNPYRLLQVMNLCMTSGDMEERKSPLDQLMQNLEEIDRDSYAVRLYTKFRIAANRTLRSIAITANARLAIFDTPEIKELTSEDDVDITSIGRQKTALFVVVSDTDRSLDNLVNLFFTQAMNELCRYADKECEDNCLPVPVWFILDDFATNCKIEEFPRMIASIRSRGISTMLMIQAEAQLAESYGEDAQTIIGNCDSYVYLGGNDIKTAQAIAERCDVPLRKILYMPVGSNWIFRRGQEPVNGCNLNLEDFLRENDLVGEANVIDSEVEDGKLYR